MKRRYVTADVFTDRLFGGNPLAVVLDAEGLSTRQMQAIALEFNYSESTFVLPPEDPALTARIRIFTPRTEVPFAGHPNVGTAYLLAHEYRYHQAAAAGATLASRRLGRGVSGQADFRVGADHESVLELDRRLVPPAVAATP